MKAIYFLTLCALALSFTGCATSTPEIVKEQIYIKQTNISMISQFMERLKQSPEFEVELEKRLLEHHQRKETINNNEKELYLRLKKKYENKITGIDPAINFDSKS